MGYVLFIGKMKCIKNFGWKDFPSEMVNGKSVWSKLI